MEAMKKSIIFQKKHYLQPVGSLVVKVSGRGRMRGRDKSEGEEGERVRVQHTGGEGQSVSHWKMQREGEGVREEKEGWSKGWMFSLNLLENEFVLTVIMHVCVFRSKT